MCEGADHRRLTRMDADGTVTTIAERWQGKRFKKPNNVVCRSNGSLFFTDPELRLAPARREIGFSGVYRLDPQGEVHLATDACAYPNGLAFSPDASILSVAISRLDQRCFAEEQQGAVCTHRRIRAFDVAPDGRLSNNRMFDMSSADPGVPDGLKVDTAGQMFCVGSGGIWVIAPSGEIIGVIRTPEVVRDLAFGGPDFRTLYLTLKLAEHAGGANTRDSAQEFGWRRARRRSGVTAPRRMLLNAFHMNCVSHIQQGLWVRDDTRQREYTQLEPWVELAQILEKGCFDALFLADVIGLYDAYRGSTATSIIEAMQDPVNEPALLIPAMAYVAEHLGFPFTSSVLQTPPFTFARQLSTLDHLTVDGWHGISSPRTYPTPRQGWATAAYRARGALCQANEVPRHSLSFLEEQLKDGPVQHPNGVCNQWC